MPSGTYIRTEYHKQRLRNGSTRFWLGKTRSLEDVEKFKLSHIGKKLTEAHKLKIGKSLLGKKRPEFNWRKPIEERLTLAADYRKPYQIAYKARKKNAEGSFTLREWRKLKQACDNTCLSCFQKEPDIKLTADHITPLSKGGTNYIENIQPLCQKCNSKKSTKNKNFLVDYIKQI